MPEILKSYSGFVPKNLVEPQRHSDIKFHKRVGTVGQTLTQRSSGSRADRNKKSHAEKNSVAQYFEIMSEVIFVLRFYKILTISVLKVWSFQGLDEWLCVFQGLVSGFSG